MDKKDCDLLGEAYTASVNEGFWDRLGAKTAGQTAGLKAGVKSIAQKGVGKLSQLAGGTYKPQKIDANKEKKTATLNNIATRHAAEITNDLVKLFNIDANQQTRIKDIIYNSIEQLVNTSPKKFAPKQVPPKAAVKPNPFKAPRNPTINP